MPSGWTEFPDWLDDLKQGVALDDEQVLLARTAALVRQPSSYRRRTMTVQRACSKISQNSDP